jgi:cellulose synthase/poly-beta-1,6-N-acetylglucosamine synthase-like glycosyltransferase
VAAAIMIIISLILAAFAAATLWWTMHAWRTPETLASTRFTAPDGDHRLTFSLLVPARHEEAVLSHTVERLLESSHQGFEVIIIVGHDDPETAEVAHRVASSAPGRVLVVTDHNEQKNKPRAVVTWSVYSTPRIKCTRCCLSMWTMPSVPPAQMWCRAASS